MNRCLEYVFIVLLCMLYMTSELGNYGVCDSRTLFRSCLTFHLIHQPSSLIHSYINKAIFLNINIFSLEPFFPYFINFYKQVTTSTIAQTVLKYTAWLANNISVDPRKWSSYFNNYIHLKKYWPKIILRQKLLVLQFLVMKYIKLT